MLLGLGEFRCPRDVKNYLENGDVASFNRAKISVRQWPILDGLTILCVAEAPSWFCQFSVLSSAFPRTSEAACAEITRSFIYRSNSPTVPCIVLQGRQVSALLRPGAERINSHEGLPFHSYIDTVIL